MKRHDRRQSPRLRPERTPWQPAALLRPGKDVNIIDLSGGGALVESACRMSPGTRTELQLFGPRKRSIRGLIVRCRVTALSPVRYQGAIVFDEHLEMSVPEVKHGAAHHRYPRAR
jgi:hypothetical protein